MKLRKFVYYKSTSSFNLASILTSPLARRFIVECIVNIIHMPVLPTFLYVSVTNNNIPYMLTYDDFIAVFMMARLYIVGRMFQNTSQYTNLQSYRICQLNGFVPDTLFAIKCYMKTMAMLFLLIISCSAIIIFGLIVRKFEA